MTDCHPIPPEMRSAIASQFDTIATEEDVRIHFAVETGSRAWGSPSPDSDINVRFVYARRREGYLSIDSRRDVIERPIGGPERFFGELLARKAETRELGAGPRVPELDTLAEAEIADARDRLETLTEPPVKLLAEANALFLALVSEGR